MYDFIDRPLQSLNYPNRFYIWAMRQWVLAVQSKSCPCELLSTAFAKWKIANALPDFLIAMAHLNQGAREKAQFGMPRCCHVHEMEAILLAIHRESLNGGSAVQWRVAEQILKQEAVVPYLTGLQRYCDHIAASPLCLAQLPRSESRGH